MAIIAHLARLCDSEPNRILFEENNKSISAFELYQAAQRVATQLKTLNIPSSSNVAIYLPRGIPGTVGIYGVLMSNCCYVPIDTQSPNTRICQIIKDAQCSGVIGQGVAPHWITNLKIAYVNIEDLSNFETNRFNETVGSKEDRAAILYTSGSTGKPKGVVISHRAILAFSSWVKTTFSIQPSDRIANLTPYYFDLSLFDLFAAPINGACTVYIPDALKLAPAKLANWLIEKAITSWYTVPSILVFLLLKGGLADKNFNMLRQILFAGEVFPTAKLIHLTKLLPKTNFYNLFGPTETNVCLYWSVKTDQLQIDQSIPIGLPACDATITICPKNEELLVAGPCLMSGYWNGNVANLNLDDEGWYHTGDKVSVNKLGEYLYHGRLDRMIKSSGFRIEPSEIEVALNSMPQIISAAVVGIDDAVMGTRIVAAITAKEIDQSMVRKHVGQILPKFMQPYAYLFLESLPQLSNGKTNYNEIIKIFKAKQVN